MNNSKFNTDTAGAASFAGSVGGDDFNISKKHMSESSKLKEVFKLYSTLEERPICKDIQDEEEEGDLLSSDANILENDGEGPKKQFLSRARKSVCGRLFKINHVLLSELIVTGKVYHLMLLFEFL